MSAPPEASVLPSGENATRNTAAVWPSSVRGSEVNGALHTRTWWSWPALASRVPSAENVTCATWRRFPRSSARRAPLKSHRRTAPSPPPVARRPSGETSIDQISPACARSAFEVPAPRSWKRSTPSQLVDARRVPSCEKATARTSPWWPSSWRRAPPSSSHSHTPPFTEPAARRLPSSDSWTLSTAVPSTSSERSGAPGATRRMRLPLPATANSFPSRERASTHSTPGGSMRLDAVPR